MTALGFTIGAMRSTARPEMALALRFGFVVLLIALAVGAAMIARGVPLARSGHAQRAYESAGALKPLHGVTMHAVLVVPGAAWLSGLTSWTDRGRRRVVWFAMLAYTAAILVVAFQA
jgi:hypothetical protein